MKKLSKKELENLNEAYKKVQNVFSTISVLELQKQYAVKEAMVLNEDLEEIKKKLESKYGQCNIDLATGKLSEKE
jgi:uncharacterized membrane protein YgaE (UPF0421/DUF939 family)